MSQKKIRLTKECALRLRWPLAGWCVADRLAHLLPSVAVSTTLWVYVEYRLPHLCVFES